MKNFKYNKNYNHYDKNVLFKQIKIKLQRYFSFKKKEKKIFDDFSIFSVEQSKVYYSLWTSDIIIQIILIILNCCIIKSYYSM